MAVTPPRASLDPFSLSAAETERQKEEVERNQALIYEMLGVPKEDDPDRDNSLIEEPKSPAALLEDLTAALRQEDDDKKKAAEKQGAAEEAAMPPPPAVLSRQDTPLPGVIQRVSEEAKKEREEEEKRREEEEKEKHLPPVHSRPGEGPRARPPSEAVSPRQLPKKEDGRVWNFLLGVFCLYFANG